jgi:hypothetical protein
MKDVYAAASPLAELVRSRDPDQVRELATYWADLDNPDEDSFHPEMIAFHSGIFRAQWAAQQGKPILAVVTEVTSSHPSFIYYFIGDEAEVTAALEQLPADPELGQDAI